MMFFLLAQAKLLFLAVTFYAISRLTKNGIIFFIQGVSVLYLTIAIAGLTRAFRNFFHGT